MSVQSFLAIDPIHVEIWSKMEDRAILLAWLNYDTISRTWPRNVAVLDLGKAKLRMYINCCLHIRPVLSSLSMSVHY